MDDTDANTKMTVEEYAIDLVAEGAEHAATDDLNELNQVTDDDHGPAMDLALQIVDAVRRHPAVVLSLVDRTAGHDIHPALLDLFTVQAIDREGLDVTLDEARAGHTRTDTWRDLLGRAYQAGYQRGVVDAVDHSS